MDRKFFNDSSIQNDTHLTSDYHASRGSRSLPQSIRTLFSVLVGDAIRGALAGDRADERWIFGNPEGHLKFLDICLAMGIDSDAVREAVRYGDLDAAAVGKALVYRNGAMRVG